jgi:hypothetical protein
MITMHHPPPKHQPSQRPGIPVFSAISPLAPSHHAASTDHTHRLPPPRIISITAGKCFHPSARALSLLGSRSHAAKPAATYLCVCLLRVTSAPTPSYVEHVVHVAACSRRWRCATLHARGHTALCLQWDGAWMGGCVYSTTGCTAESSRVESGAWWHRSCSGGVPPTRRRGTPTTQRGQCGTSTSTGGRWRADTRRAASLRARCYAREGSGGRR